MPGKHSTLMRAARCVAVLAFAANGDAGERRVGLLLLRAIEVAHAQWQDEPAKP